MAPGHSTRIMGTMTAITAIKSTHPEALGAHAPGGLPQPATV